MDIELTPTQQRIYAMLSDGCVHRAEELATCLDDELAGDSALRAHISMIRKILRESRNGEDIISRYGEGYYLARAVSMYNE